MNVCRYPSSNGYVSMWVRQSSGHVQYYATSGGYSYYSSNQQFGAGPYALGADVAFDVKATDGASNVYRMSGTIPLSTSPADYGYSYCDWYWYGECYSYSRTGTFMNGGVSF